MQTMIVRVNGITPLLPNAPTLMMQASGGPKTRKSIPSPEEEAAAGRYLLDGQLVFPTGAFRKCAINGARGRKIGRVGLGTILMGALFPADEFTTLLNAKGKPLGENDYEIDTRRAVPKNQGAVMRSRPKVWPWMADVHFEFDEEITDAESVAEVLSMGGRTVGIGNFRPEKGGTFGRFTVESYG